MQSSLETSSEISPGPLYFTGFIIPFIDNLRLNCYIDIFNTPKKKSEVLMFDNLLSFYKSFSCLNKNYFCHN